MENTIEQNTFDVLMEGTMYGAQIDTVLMEAEAPKKSLDNSGMLGYILALKDTGSKVNAEAAQKAYSAYNNAIAEVTGKYATADAGAKGASKELKKRTSAFATAVSAFAAIKPKGDDKKEAEVKALKAAVAEAKKNLTLMQKAMVYVNKALSQITKVAKVVMGADVAVANWKSIAVTVGLIIGGYSVAYGVLKTISGVAVSSFLAIKGNITAMYRVAKDPKKYGAKSFIFSALLGTVLVGVGRLAVTLGKVMKVLFDKGGKAVKVYKEKKAEDKK